MDERRARSVLGLGHTAEVSPGDVESAFRRQAHLSHPDTGGDPATFRDLVTARRTLRDTPLPVTASDPVHRRPAPVTVVPDRTWWREILAAIRDRRASRSRNPRVQ